MPDILSADTIYRLKVTLADVRPTVWRRLEVRGHLPLSTLHEILQVAMGWNNSHLHEFQVGNVAYGEPSAEYEDDRDMRDDRRVRLDRAVPAAGSTFTYLYDFGDGWTHRIKVEAIEPSDPTATYPRLVGGARACPPDDVGGPWGYADFLTAIADPASDEHGEMLEWVGGSFDPEAFDRDGNNEVLVDLFAKARRGPSGSGASRTRRQTAAPAPIYLARVSTNGQVTIPKPVRESLGLAVGSPVVFVVNGSVAMIMRDPRDGPDDGPAQ